MYFLFILKINIVYSHLFYIPVVLASFWWQRKGLILLVFLVVFLLLFPIFLGLNLFIIYSIENFYRLLILIAISNIVAFLSHNILKREKEKKEAYSELDQIFNLTIPICIIDKNFNLIHANDTFFSYFHLKKNEVINKKCYDMWQEEVCNTPTCSLKQILKGKGYYDYEIDKKLGNGTMSSCIVTAIPYKNSDGELIGVIENFTDITKRKLTEYELAISENNYRKAYNQAEFYKDLLAHDMNNILQSILSGIQLNSIYIKSPEKSEELKKNQLIIEKQVMRATKLISDIRKLSKLEEPEMKNTEIEICFILKKSITNLKHFFKDRNINIQVDSIDEKLYILANDLLEDVFDNIMINAVKYNENLSVEIIIRICKKKTEGKNHIKIEFLDNGIGINDDRKKEIFQRAFVKDRSTHGMGLGLSLVKRIIEIYNGKIWVEDRVKEANIIGSNFVILIPEVS